MVCHCTRVTSSYDHACVYCCYLYYVGFQDIFTWFQLVGVLGYTGIQNFACQPLECILFRWIIFFKLMLYCFLFHNKFVDYMTVVNFFAIWILQAALALDCGPKIAFLHSFRSLGSGLELCRISVYLVVFLLALPEAPHCHQYMWANQLACGFHFTGSLELWSEKHHDSIRHLKIKWQLVWCIT